METKCVCFVYLCVGCFIYGVRFTVVHAVLSSVAAEKKYYLMKRRPIKTILCTYYHCYFGLVITVPSFAKHFFSDVHTSIL